MSILARKLALWLQFDGVSLCGVKATIFLLLVAKGRENLAVGAKKKNADAGRIRQVVAYCSAGMANSLCMKKKKVVAYTSGR